MTKAGRFDHYAVWMTGFNQLIQRHPETAPRRYNTDSRRAARGCISAHFAAPQVSEDCQISPNSLTKTAQVSSAGLCANSQPMAVVLSAPRKPVYWSGLLAMKVSCWFHLDLLSARYFDSKYVCWASGRRIAAGRIQSTMTFGRWLLVFDYVEAIYIPALMHTGHCSFGLQKFIAILGFQRYGKK